MTLSLNASWLAAARRKNAEVVYTVTLTDGSSSWTAQSGPHASMTYPAHLLEVSELAAEIDPITRQLEIGETEIVLTDAFARPIVSGTRIRGQKATVKIGFYDLAEGSFENYFVGPIEGVKPDGATVTLTCLSALEVLRQHKIVGAWYRLHPLDIMHDILATKVGLHADLIDADSFDPDNYTGISHFVAARFTGRPTANQVYVDTAVREPTTAFDLLDELARLMHGTVYVTHAGKVSFRIFDASASAAATWTSDDFSEPEILATDDNVINRVEVQLTDGYREEGSWADLYVHQDTTAQGDLAYPGTSERVVTHKIETQWLPSFFRCKPAGAPSDNSSFITAAATSFIISGNLVLACSGTQTTDRSATGAAATDEDISASRLLYLLTDAGEIISATGLADNASVGNTNSYLYDPETGGATETGNYKNHLDVTGATRGVGGTVAAPFGYAVDVTIPYHLADKILKRANYGLKRIKLKTPRLTEYDKEVGDLVQIVWPQFLAYGFDGVTSSQKWEITRKEMTETGLVWELAWAGENSYTVSLDPIPVQSVGDRASQVFGSLLTSVAAAQATDWAEQTNPKNFTLNGVCFGPDLFVAVGNSDGTNSYIITSPDGETWTERNPTVSKTIALNSVTYGGGVYVAVGAADGSDAYVLSSTDGTTWTERANAKNFALHSVCYGNGTFVAVGGADGTDAYILSSTDGSTWTERANPKNFELRAVTYGNDLFVAMGATDGSDTYCITSPDGTTWTERSMPTTDQVEGITYGNGLFVAVGAPDATDAAVFTSANGTSWTEQENPSTGYLLGVAHGAGLFTAVGSQTVGAGFNILTSPDGLTWTERTGPASFYLNEVAYGDGIFVAVGQADGTNAFIVTTQVA
jgi:hypothetical protein